MFTTEAMMSPMSAMVKNEPKELRSFLVTKPMNDMAANIPAVTKNAVAMDVDV